MMGQMIVDLAMALMAFHAIVSLFLTLDSVDECDQMTFRLALAWESLRVVFAMHYLAQRAFGVTYI